jgi:hypothetical protein
LLILNGPLNQTISTPDSISYRYIDSTVEISPYLGNYDLQILSKIDFWGNALRPWPFNLVLNLIGSDRLTSIFFIILAAFSWTLLYQSILKLFHTNLFLKILCTFAVFFFLISPQIYTWNDFILSESFVSSLSLIFLSIFIHLYIEPIGLKLSKFRVYQLSVLLVLYLILAVSRPTLGISLSILILSLILRFSRNISSMKYLLGAFVLITQVYVGFVTNNSSNQWERVLGTSISGTTFSHLSDLRDQKSQNFVNYVRERGAPDCLVNNDLKNTYPWFFSRTYATNCPSGIKWLEKDFPKTYIFYLFSDSNFRELVLNQFFISLQGDDYFKYYSEQKSINLLTPLNDFVWNKTNLYFTIKFIFVTFFALLLALFRFIRSTSSKRLFSANSIFILFSITGLINVLLTRILMPDDYGRLGYPGSIYFNLFSLILIFSTLDKLVLRPVSKLLNFSFVKV